MLRGGLIALLALTAQARLLTPVWVQAGEGKLMLARVVVAEGSGCPVLRVDGAERAMQLRGAPPSGFQPVCELALPAGTRQASADGQRLALPRENPVRIVVIGDTGCRVKGARLQNCADPAQWPLERLATRAAAEKPDLVIHVGDYLYREDACPDRNVCGSGPHGDNWATWEADFFQPAQALLAGAPWVFARGNHEDCNRSWRGWFYYLDPRPWAGACQATHPAYTVDLDRMSLFVMDTTAGTAGEYTREMGQIRGSNVWVVTHHPFFTLQEEGQHAVPRVSNETLVQSWDRVKPKNVTLLLAGHTHLFELLSAGGAYPPQLVAGDGGTALYVAMPKLIRDGASVHDFGFTLLEKEGSGWKLTLKGVAGQTLTRCAFHKNMVACRM